MNSAWLISIQIYYIKPPTNLNISIDRTYIKYTIDRYYIILYIYISISISIRSYILILYILYIYSVFKLNTRLATIETINSTIVVRLS